MQYQTHPASVSKSLSTTNYFSIPKIAKPPKIDSSQHPRPATYQHRHFSKTIQTCQSRSASLAEPPNHKSPSAPPWPPTTKTPHHPLSPINPEPQILPPDLPRCGHQSTNPQTAHDSANSPGGSISRTTRMRTQCSTPTSQVIDRGPHHWLQRTPRSTLLNLPPC